MQRSAWIATGAIVASLAVAETALPLAALLMLAAAALAGGLVLMRRNAGLAVASLAAAILVGRVLVGLATDPAINAPSSSAEAAGPDWTHEAVVLSLNAPSAGQQRATLEL